MIGVLVLAALVLGGAIGGLVNRRSKRVGRTAPPRSIDSARSGTQAGWTNTYGGP